MDDWKSKRIFLNDKLSEKSLFNAILYIENLYTGLFARCCDTDAVYLITQPPWDNNQAFNKRRITEADVIRLAAELEQYGLNISVIISEQAIKAVADKTLFKSPETATSWTRLSPAEYIAPPEWFDIIKNEVIHQDYAYPKELLFKVLPDKDHHTPSNHRRLTGILRKLDYRSIVEHDRGKNVRRWKKMTNSVY